MGDGYNVSIDKKLDPVGCPIHSVNVPVTHRDWQSSIVKFIGELRVMYLFDAASYLHTVAVYAMSESFEDGDLARVFRFILKSDQPEGCKIPRVKPCAGAHFQTAIPG
ncbi:hypothetical protein C8J36_11041 [Rhizobium sp. PP-F2F-G48]|nr:hypothetical protein C8J36_11041 [Rhizobium sp. PP-F2F-G48]